MRIRLTPFTGSAATTAIMKSTFAPITLVSLYCSGSDFVEWWIRMMVAPATQSWRSFSSNGSVSLLRQTLTFAASRPINLWKLSTIKRGLSFRHISSNAGLSNAGIFLLSLNNRTCSLPRFRIHATYTLRRPSSASIYTAGRCFTVKLSNTFRLLQTHLPI